MAKFSDSETGHNHRFWAQETLNQFGYANNLFIVISTAIIGYVFYTIDNNQLYKTISCQRIHGPSTFLFISLWFLILSIISGIITVFSRLYDLRLTRHKYNIQEKLNNYSLSTYGNETNNNSGTQFEIKYIDIQGNTKWPAFQITQLQWLIGALWKDDYFLTDDDIEKLNQHKFDKLCERALLLGKLSWHSFKMQTVWLILACLFLFTGWILI